MKSVALPSLLIFLAVLCVHVNGQATAPTIKGIFGSFDQIGDIVSKVNFSMMDSSGQDSLYVALAPAFGDLNAETIKSLDTNLLIAIAGTNRVISKLDPAARTWSKVESIMSQNPFLDPVDAGIRRSDKYIRKDTNYFQFDRSLRPEVYQEVKTWFFEKLVQDHDMIASTRIQSDALPQIVAYAGSTVADFLTVYKHDYYEKTMVDIGVLRYPDSTNKFFKLTAWADSMLVMGLEKETNGITGEFYFRTFKPRTSVISGMKKEIQAKAANEAKSMFTIE